MTLHRIHGQLPEDRRLLLARPLHHHVAPLPPAHDGPVPGPHAAAGARHAAAALPRLPRGGRRHLHRLPGLRAGLPHRLHPDHPGEGPHQPEAAAGDPVRHRRGQVHVLRPLRRALPHRLHPAHPRVRGLGARTSATWSSAGPTRAKPFPVYKVEKGAEYFPRAPLGSLVRARLEAVRWDAAAVEYLPPEPPAAAVAPAPAAGRSPGRRPLQPRVEVGAPDDADHGQDPRLDPRHRAGHRLRGGDGPAGHRPRRAGHGPPAGHPGRPHRRPLLRHRRPDHRRRRRRGPLAQHPLQRHRPAGRAARGRARSTSSWPPTSSPSPSCSSTSAACWCWCSSR